MSSKNSESNRVDFQKCFMEINPEGSIQRTSHGVYVDKETNYAWAAYKKAFQQYSVNISKASHLLFKKATSSKVYIVGKVVSNVDGESDSFVFGKKPFRHYSVLKAEQERQRLEKFHTGQKFGVFGLVEVPEETKQKVAEMPKVILKYKSKEEHAIDAAWKTTEKELLEIKRSMCVINNEKDIDTAALTILRKRSIGLHHERIVLNIQRSKLQLSSE